MTTYQDPPLHSRRAARQGERADGAAAPMSSSDSVEHAIASGAAEPLNYATTSRPPLPQYDAQNLRPRRSVEPTHQGDLPPTEALATQDAPRYRSRDFSPEGRRATPSWAPQYGGVGDDGNVEFRTQGRESVPVNAAVMSSDPVPADRAEDPASPATPLGEYTMTRRELRALREAGLITDVTDLSLPIVLPVAAEPVAEPAAAQPAVADPVVPAPEATAAVAPIAVPIPLVPPAPQPSSRLNSALAEFDALAAGREPSIQEADAPAPVPGRRAAAPRDSELAQVGPEGAQAPAATTLPESTETLSAFDALFQPPSLAVASVVAVPVDQDAPQQDVVEAELIEMGHETDSSGTSATAATLSAPPLDSLFGVPAPQGSPAPVPPPRGVSTPVSEPAVGHWSIQSDIDDAEQINDSTISRSLGAGNSAITTSALVLPSIPDHGISVPLGDGSQVLLTGSISLPDSLSMSGAMPSQLDVVDIDHLLDPGDKQLASTDSAPVRAIRAVSTHTATGGIIAPAKPKGTRGFTILIIAASTMAVVVVGLLIAGLVSGTL